MCFSIYITQIFAQYTGTFTTHKHKLWLRHGNICIQNLSGFYPPLLRSAMETDLPSRQCRNGSQPQKKTTTALFFKPQKNNSPTTKLNSALFKHNPKTRNWRANYPLACPQINFLHSHFWDVITLTPKPNRGKIHLPELESFWRRRLLPARKSGGCRLIDIHKSLIYVPEPASGLGTSVKRTSGSLLAVDGSFLFGKANPSFSPCYCDALWRLLSVKRIRRVIHGVMCA